MSYPRVIGWVAPALVCLGATCAFAIGARYMLPEAVRATLSVQADPAAPGTFTLEGTFKAVAIDARGVTVGFRLPDDVVVLEGRQERKGTLVRGKDVSLRVKVRLKEGVASTLVGFGATYDEPTDDWLRYIEDHKKDVYPNEVLRDLLVEKVRARKGIRASVGQTMPLSRSGDRQ